MSDAQRLLQASMEILQLQREVEILRADNRFLRARLEIVALRRLRAMREPTPALLRPQI